MGNDTKPAFAQNPQYLEHERLLKELHDLIKVGKNNTDEANAVREKMEDPWYSLSQEEHDRLSGLSADLYSLSGEEIPILLTVAEECQLIDAINTALQNKKWEEALGLYRKGPQIYSARNLAARRATCWYELGHYRAACWFFLEAPPDC